MRMIKKENSMEVNLNEKEKLELIEKRVEIQKKRLDIKKEKMEMSKLGVETEKEQLDLIEKRVEIRSKQITRFFQYCFRLWSLQLMRIEQSWVVNHFTRHFCREKTKKLQ